MTWNDYLKKPKMTFRTPAPKRAPEVKGYRCYFRPEWLEWLVRPGEIRVGAFGPPTRTSSFGGEMWWSVEGRRGDERPAWLLLPNDPLARAVLGVESVQASLEGEIR